jgi:hypothetical protein
VATKKQQRRKYKRAVAHGRLAEEREPGEEREPAAPRARAQGAPVRIGAREIKPPSYLRAARRALLMSLALFAAVQVLSFGGSKPSPAGAALQAAVFFCWLTPFGYFMDMFIYRRAVKRQQRHG